MSQPRSAHRHLHPLPNFATVIHTPGSTYQQARPQPSPSPKPDYPTETRPVSLRRHAHVRRSPGSKPSAAAPRGRTGSESSAQLSAFPRPPLQGVRPWSRARTGRLGRVADPEDSLALEDEDEICAWIAGFGHGFGLGIGLVDSGSGTHAGFGYGFGSEYGVEDMTRGEGHGKRSGDEDEVRDGDEGLDCFKSTYWESGEESWLDSSSLNSERADSDANTDTDSTTHPSGNDNDDDPQSDDAYLISGDIHIGLDRIGLEHDLLGLRTNADHHAVVTDIETDEMLMSYLDIEPARAT